MFCLLESAVSQLSSLENQMDTDESPPSPTLSVNSSGLPFTVQDVNSDYTPQSTKVGVLYFK